MVDPNPDIEKLSLRAKRSNLLFCDQIATNPSGARNDWHLNAFLIPYRDLGEIERRSNGSWGLILFDGFMKAMKIEEITSTCLHLTQTED